MGCLCPRRVIQEDSVRQQALLRDPERGEANAVNEDTKTPGDRIETTRLPAAASTEGSQMQPSAGPLPKLGLQDMKSNVSETCKESPMRAPRDWDAANEKIRHPDADLHVPTSTSAVDSSFSVASTADDLSVAGKDDQHEKISTPTAPAAQQSHTAST